MAVTTKKAAGSLFNKAKATAAVKTVDPKVQKTRISIKDGGEFFDKVMKLEQLQDNMKRDKAAADMLADEIKQESKDKWVEMYDKSGRNPGSIMVEAKKGLDTAQVMFVPSDKYISVNANTAESLSKKYGEEIIEEKTTFSFDNDMIDQYGEVISRLIEESDEISEEDKGRIIKAVATYSITKGTIDVMKTYGPVSQIMEEVKPVIALKNVEVIKG